MDVIYSASEVLPDDLLVKVGVVPISYYNHIIPILCNRTLMISFRYNPSDELIPNDLKAIEFHMRPEDCSLNDESPIYISKSYSKLYSSYIDGGLDFYNDIMSNIICSVLCELDTFFHKLALLVRIHDVIINEKKLIIKSNDISSSPTNNTVSVVKRYSILHCLDRIVEDFNKRLGEDWKYVIIQSNNDYSLLI